MNRGRTLNQEEAKTRVGPHRLFFALWPDAGALRELERLSKELALLGEGKAVPRDKIHLTLAFLGEVPPEGLDRARAAASEALAAPFDVALDCVGSFHGARVAWAGNRAPSKALLEFQARLARALRARGFELEERPYAPHLTLARGIGKAVPRAPIAPIEWRARELALVRSERGTGRYTTEEVWELL